MYEVHPQGCERPLSELSVGGMLRPLQQRLMKFCANKLCPLHTEVEEGKRTLRVLGPRGEPLTFTLHTFSLTDEKKTLDLCDVCSNVLAMVHGIGE